MLLIWDVVLLKMVPALNSGVAFLEADLAGRLLVVAGGRAVVVVASLARTGVVVGVAVAATTARGR